MKNRSKIFCEEPYGVSIEAIETPSRADRFQALCELSQEMALVEDEWSIYRVVLEVARDLVREPADLRERQVFALEPPDRAQGSPHVTLGDRTRQSAASAKRGSMPSSATEFRKAFRRPRASMHAVMSALLLFCFFCGDQQLFRRKSQTLNRCVDPRPHLG